MLWRLVDRAPPNELTNLQWWGPRVPLPSSTLPLGHSLPSPSPFPPWGPHARWIRLTEIRLAIYQYYTSCVAILNQLLATSRQCFSIGKLIGDWEVSNSFEAEYLDFLWTQMRRKELNISPRFDNDFIWSYDVSLSCASPRQWVWEFQKCLGYL